MPGGRPAKLTPDVKERILQALSVGTPVELATTAAGVSYATFRRWLKRGERETKGEYREFYRAVAESRGRALTRWLAIIDKQAQGGDWKAAAWKAEHAFPEFFGKTQIDLKTSGKIQHEVAGKVQIDLTKVPEEDLKALERILAKQQDAAAGPDAPPGQGGAGA